MHPPDVLSGMPHILSQKHIPDTQPSFTVQDSQFARGAKHLSPSHNSPASQIWLAGQIDPICPLVHHQPIQQVNPLLHPVSSLHGASFSPLVHVNQPG